MIRNSVLPVLAASLCAVGAEAQVRAVVQVNAVPVTAQVIVNPAPARVVYVRRPVVYAPRPVVIRPVVAPAVVMVERVPHRGQGWWRKKGYVRTVLYTDGRYYYDTAYYARPGLVPVTVYAKSGRYVVMDDRGHSDRYEREG